MKNIPLDLFRLIVACDETQSLLKASMQLGISLTSASRLLSNFEKTEGITLLNRRVRPASFTENFHRLVPIAKRMIATQTEAERDINALRAHSARSKRRVVRFSLPINVRNSQVFVNLVAYAQKHDIQLEFFVDPGGIPKLLSRAVDIAQVGYWPENPQIYKRYIRTNGFLILATPAFIERYGNPSDIHDLERLPIALRSPSNSSASRKFERGEEVYYLPEGENLIYADPLSCQTLLKEGLAITVDLSIGMVLEDLEKGVVVPILPGWFREPNNTFVCCRHEDAKDPVIKDLMKILHNTLRAETKDRWDYRYTKLGLPVEMLELYRRSETDMEELSPLAS